jgi:hypothetical protein
MSAGLKMAYTLGTFNVLSFGSIAVLFYISKVVKLQNYGVIFQ